MAFADIHSHLPIVGDEKAFRLLAEAREKGLSDLIINSLDRISFEQAKSFIGRYNNSDAKNPVKLKIAVGMYPLSGLKEDVKSGVIENADLDYDKLAGIIAKEKGSIAAVGEIGLDFKAVRKDDAKEDIECFRLMLKTAERIGKPVIIHSRKAEREVIEIIKEYDVTAVLHCFSGKISLARKALENPNVYFSIPLIIGHSEHFWHLADAVPTGRLLTETDTPFMPLKGKEISEPSDIPEAIENIAEIKGISSQEMENILFANYKRVF